MKEREGCWDFLKFFLIVLVVFGHFLGPNTCSSILADRALFNLIYSFHMPLFVFISGRFSSTEFKGKYLFSIIRLLETYLVFQIVLFFVYYYHSTDTPAHIVYELIVYPRFALWYLFCLIVWRLSLFIIEWLRKKISINNETVFNVIMVVLSLLIGLSSGFISLEHQFSFQRLFSFFPFFVLGFASRNFRIKEALDRHLNVWISCAVLVSIIVSFQLLFNKSMDEVVTNSYSYLSFGSYSKGLIYRFIYYTLALIISTLLIRLSPVESKLSKYGRITLFVYVYHIFIVKSMQGIHLCPVMIYVVSFLTIVILLALTRISLLSKLLNPISNALTLKKGLR